jgi:UDP-glucose:(galactosyl)LPS alpha-1,2-glucosyltransferase
MKIIPVFYTISDNYTPYAYVSIQSLIDHADPNKDYTITLLVQEISPEHKKELRRHVY